MKRRPSASRTAAGLWRLAYKAESQAGRLRELGLDDHARAIDSAANALSSAAIALEQRATLARVGGAP